MSEIPTYPNECGHRQDPERCWQCLTLQNCVLKDALRVEKARADGAREGTRRCHACEQVRADVGELLDRLPLCAQCAKAYRMGYRCGEWALLERLASEWPEGVLHKFRPDVVGTEVLLIGGARVRIEAAYVMFELETGQWVSRDCFNVVPKKDAAG